MKGMTRKRGMYEGNGVSDINESIVEKYKGYETKE